MSKLEFSIGDGTIATVGSKVWDGKYPLTPSLVTIDRIISENGASIVLSVSQVEHPARIATRSNMDLFASKLATFTYAHMATQTVLDSHQQLVMTNQSKLAMLGRLIKENGGVTEGGSN